MSFQLRDASWDIKGPDYSNIKGVFIAEYAGENIIDIISCNYWNKFPLFLFGRIDNLAYHLPFRPAPAASTLLHMFLGICLHMDYANLAD